MIRIAFLIRSLEYGGSERQLAALVNGLDPKRFDVSVITFYAGGALEEEFTNKNIKLFCLRKRGRWELFGFLWRLVQELRAIRPDILHPYLVEPNLVSVLIKPLISKTKIVFGIRASDMELKRYDWFIRMNFRLQTLASRFADLIIANSESGREYHVALGFPPQNCIVIHGGVDTERFRPDPESGRRVRAEWGFANGAILIGCVARLDPVKDHPTFLRAAALLARERADVRFVCIGSGPENYASRLRRLAESEGIADRIVWAGERSDVAAVYNAVNIVCSSSSGEGFPNAIAEAMACDLSCVVTDVGDSALLVGDTGIVVPPGNPRALARGLSECVAQLTSARESSPRARIEEFFTVDQLADKTAAALRELGHRAPVY